MKMKMILLMLSFFVLNSIGYGQVRTVAQQEAVNQTANWIEVGKSENGDRAYLDTSDVTKVVTLALFNVKMEVKGVLMYTTVAVNCVEETYISVNVFVQSSPSAKLFRMEQYDMKKAVSFEEGDLLFNMAVYACTYGVSADK